MSALPSIEHRAVAFQQWALKAGLDIRGWDGKIIRVTNPHGYSDQKTYYAWCGWNQACAWATEPEVASVP